MEALELDSKDKDDKSKGAEIDDAGEHEEQNPRKHPANRPITPPGDVHISE